MVFYTDYKNQQWLLPPNIEDLIPKDHICYLVDEIIESIDFRDIEDRYKGPGHPAYHPKIILKLLLMGAIDGIRSSRKISRNAKENIIYMFLTGKLKPDFRTISDFRKNNPELVKFCFKEVVKFAKNLGMVRFGHLSIDGTKIKASASRDKTLTKEELQFLEEIIENEIAEGIKEDLQEDNVYGEDKDGYGLPDSITLNEHIKKFIQKRLEEKGIKCSNKKAITKIIKDYLKGNKEKKDKIEDCVHKAHEELNKSDMNAISLTDPESRFMKNKNGHSEHSYNAQITVDKEQNIIVANDVVQDRNDRNQLISQIEQSEENIGHELPKGIEISADNQYYKGKNLKYLDDRGFDGYIPDKNIAQMVKGRSAKKNPYSKENFEYNQANDTFVCPNGMMLTFRYEYFDKYNKRKIRIYKGTICRDCVHYKECVKNKEGIKTIVSYGFEKEKLDMVRKFETENGLKKYKTRAKIVECVFGDILRNGSMREFLTRGIRAVKTEFNLGCVAHNIKRIYTFIRKIITGNADNYEIASKLNLC